MKTNQAWIEYCKSLSPAIVETCARTAVSAGGTSLARALHGALPDWQFRHALAVHMLKGGASLPEIGEVLRHRSPIATSIYAKVDVASLRSLAMPWPGGAS